MIASVVLAIAVLAVCYGMSAAFQQSQALRQSAIAAGLAEQLLEEISSRPLCRGDGTCANGPDAGQTIRDAFTSVGNFNGFTDTTANMLTAGGQPVQPGDGGLYARAVSVQFLNSASGPVVSAGDFALATVTVTTPSQQTVKLSRLLSKTSWQL